MAIPAAAASQVACCSAGCPRAVGANSWLTCNQLPFQCRGSIEALLLRPSLSKEHQQFLVFAKPAPLVLQALPTCITHGYAFHSMLSVWFLFSDHCLTIFLLFWDYRMRQEEEEGLKLSDKHQLDILYSTGTSGKTPQWYRRVSAYLTVKASARSLGSTARLTRKE